MPGNSHSGRGGLPLPLRRRILRLLSEGWPYGCVARVLHVDVKTVKKIFVEMQAAEAIRGRERLEYERCPDCGAKVIADAPCLACQIRRTTRSK